MCPASDHAARVTMPEKYFSKAHRIMVVRFLKVTYFKILLVYQHYCLARYPEHLPHVTDKLHHATFFNFSQTGSRKEPSLQARNELIPHPLSIFNLFIFGHKISIHIGYNNNILQKLGLSCVKLSSSWS